MDNKNKIYKTDNFYLSAYLISENFLIDSLEGTSNPNKFIFCFYDNDNLRQCINDFLTFKAYVRPQDYANAERNLRSAIYSNKNKDF